MDCCLTPEEKEQKRLSRDIDRLLKREQREIKLLLLGTGESGKSTFIKQMRIIHGSGYSEDDRREFIPLIYQNIFVAIQTMINAMERLNISYDNPDNRECSYLVNNCLHSAVTTIEEPILSAIKSLWADMGVRECYSRRREYQLADSAKYFLNELDRIVNPDYIPIEKDILLVRIPTTGIIEYPFRLGDTQLRVIDVGGQRSQRRKWLQCFDEVTAVIFLAAVSEYDQILMEAENVNRLQESINLFKEIISTPWFVKSTVILFLNKIDLFEEKIQSSHLADYFPNYYGPRCNSLTGGEFIQNLFLDSAGEIYSHFTCATDTKNIERIFEIVRTTIMNHYFDSIGMF